MMEGLNWISILRNVTDDIYISLEIFQNTTAKTVRGVQLFDILSVIFTTAKV